MGQTPSGPEIVSPPEKADIVCEVFSQGVVHATNKLQDYLGFEDPHGTLRPTMDTLTEVFLVDFITFCMEKGVEERISTSKMSAPQAAMLGVDWIWTLLGPDRSVRLQIAVQALQMSDLTGGGQGDPKTPHQLPDPIHQGEIQLPDKERSRYKKLEEFCRLVGPDCLGLFVVFGFPGKPKDVRGILLESVSKEETGAPGERALRQYILDTETFLPIQDLLDSCMSRRNNQRNLGKVCINFL
ncbi:rab15 effector protein [Anomaloglossus baeobatrachus]|uniref:rab15 effector protein n=1 Tax=Anomaloglossus baeobatrachus TaxID=238106 RepID=UPI003F4F7B87